jgi:rSAM/selenodomain-associated transferase 2
MKISIIIPAYNEAQTIQTLISYLKNCNSHTLGFEIIIAEGGSTDATAMLAQDAGATLICSPQKGRASQMNAGAAVASGDILYFLHADSYPPRNFSKEIIEAVEDGYMAGCYRLAFDHHHWFLKFNAWFTRFNINAIRFGDQSLFVTAALFKKIGGFDERLIIMEDQEIISRIRKHTRFKVLDGWVTTSARKYLENGIYTLQGIFFLIYVLYKIGMPQEKLIKFYKLLIKQHKV